MDEIERQMVAISQRQREEQAAIPPDQMFHSQTDKYSAFDEKGKLSTARKTQVAPFPPAGIPTHDQTGKPLSDKQVRVH